MRVKLSEQPEARYFALIAGRDSYSGPIITFYGQAPDGTIETLGRETVGTVYVGHLNQTVGLELYVHPDGMEWHYSERYAEGEVRARAMLLERADGYVSDKLNSFELVWEAMTNSALNPEVAARAAGQE